MREYLLLQLLLILVSSGSCCLQGCDCPTSTSVVCRDQRQIPILLDPRTRSLDLSNNKISRIGADELSLYPNLETLILRNNSITHISADVFSSLPSLTHLDLSANSLLQLPNRIFANLRNLKTLLIDSNDVQLSQECFLGLGRLETLSLADNRLTYLPPATLRPLTSLKNINLSNNKLMAMPASLLASLPTLNQLDLSNNLLSNLETGMFSAQKTLRRLDLSQNLIDNMEEGCLYGLEQLTVLNLTANQLVRLPGNTWSLASLQVLDLSLNLFVSLETASFDALPSLQYLNVSSSRNLKSIQMAAFVQLNSLRWLSLANSELVRVHAAAFSPVPVRLEHLDVSHNQLSSLPMGLLPYSTVSSLLLAGNPWHCTCELRALKLRPLDEALCASPVEMEHSPLGMLNECSILGGLLVPFLLAFTVLLLAIVVLALACKKPRKQHTFYNDQLINVMSQKEYIYDHRSLSSPYTYSEDSRDSAYESPTSALMPRNPPPPPPRILPTPAMAPMVPRNDYYLTPNRPITRL